MGLLNANTVLGLLDAEGRNYNVIANNLANVDTPGYRTVRVRFADELGKLVSSDGQLLPGKSISTETWRPMYHDASNDGNDVTVEREIVEMNKNQLRMRVYLGILYSRIQELRAAVQSK
jgi:flagellar basal-body rod protein FlgB